MNSDIKKRIEQIDSGQVPEGYKKEFGYVTPNDWDVKKLNELFKKVTAKNRNNKSLPVLTNSAVNGVVLQNSYFDREIVTEGNTGTYYVVEQNDFMYNPRISANALAGPINRNNLNTAGIASPLYTIFRSNEDVFLDFYESYFKSSSVLISNGSNFSCSSGSIGSISSTVLYLHSNNRVSTCSSPSESQENSVFVKNAPGANSSLTVFKAL